EASWLSRRIRDRRHRRFHVRLRGDHGRGEIAPFRPRLFRLRRGRGHARVPDAIEPFRLWRTDRKICRSAPAGFLDPALQFRPRTARGCKMTERQPKKTDLMSEAERDAYHAEKMKKKKVARDKLVATNDKEKGLLIVHTGKGKGKSTAAFGMVFRGIAHGFKVGIVQFVKGKWGTGERDILEHFPEQVSINA